MAKGSVRKKGKKWYYRFYVEDASGNLVQKEFAGTESKSETEKLLRQAMEDYESKKFIAKADNITLGELLDIWAEEELKVGTLSNGTVGNYLQAVNRIKQHPIGKRKLKTVTSEHLQQFMDLLTFGGTAGNFVSKGYTKDYVHSYSAVLQQAFRFAVFPKQFITFNPMQYVVLKKKTDDVDLFAEDDLTDANAMVLTHQMYQKLLEELSKRSRDAILPVQIAYYAGLRLGEVAGLTWQDINLEEQYLTVRRSVRYNGTRHKTEIGPTKRKRCVWWTLAIHSLKFLELLKGNSTSNAFSTDNCTTKTITKRFGKRTVCIMNITVLMAHRKYRRIIQKSPLYV